jgi:hypothetical protein
MLSAMAKITLFQLYWSFNWSGNYLANVINDNAWFNVIQMTINELILLLLLRFLLTFKVRICQNLYTNLF